MSRKAAGEEPLPEEDPANPLFKPLPEPSRLESFLITNQISNHCNQINGYFSSLFILRMLVDMPSCGIFSIYSKLLMLVPWIVWFVSRVAGQSLSKLYLAKALQEN